METRTASTWRRALQIVWRSGAFFLAFGALAAVFVVPLESQFAGWEEAHPLRTRLYFDATSLAAIAVATWVMTRFVDRRPFRTIGFETGHVPRDVTVGLAIGVGWLAASVGVAWMAGWVVAGPAASMSAGPLLAAVVSVGLNVLTQQLLLCGYVFQAIRSRSGFSIAVLISAALFTLYHAGAFQAGWVAPVNVFGAGVVFCLAYGMTANLWLPAAIHFAWNLLLGPVLGLAVSGTNELGLGWSMLGVEGPARFTGGAFGLEGGLVVTATTALLVAIMIGLHRACASASGNRPARGGSGAKRGMVDRRGAR